MTLPQLIGISAVERLNTDPSHRDRAVAMRGLLASFNQAEVLSAADVHVARQVGVLGSERSELARLAVAFTVRAVRLGSVCVDLRTVRESVVGDADPAVVAQLDPEQAARLEKWLALPWPDPDEWMAAVLVSPLVATDEQPPDPSGAGRPLRLSGEMLYLDRYFRQERLVADALDARAEPVEVTPADRDRMRAAIARLFPGVDERRQRVATAVCAARRLAVIAGGPGTGKTTTVARMLAVLVDSSGPPPRIALAAPTGKAAARLQQAVRDQVAGFGAADQQRLGTLTAGTVHRLLGWRGSKSRFRHDANRRLPYDIVVVDETSMVSLTMMARLMEALRPQARLVLVGDPDQLASVEAGAVLGDVVAREVAAATTDVADAATLDVVRDLCPGDLDAEPAPALASFAAGVTRLDHRFRFGEGQVIADLADAVRDGDADAAMTVLAAPVDPAATQSVTFVPLTGEIDGQLAGLRDEVAAAGRTLTAAAIAGDAGGALRAIEAHRLLCAHRRGPFGAGQWAALAQRWIADDLSVKPLPGNDIDADERFGWWTPGRPLLITENDYDLGLFNGDTGVVILDGDRVVAAFGDPEHPTLVRPSRLGGVQSVYAMTIHKSQGSQFTSVTVVLPPDDSLLLTRELLYTAATRASSHVRIIGTEDAVRAAIGRPVTRASGLRRR